ncbi:MAG: glucosamine-6-phosphate deaminase [Thalassotalea sp.]|nr:glucosamine-6-phosphate deaminase [Thalassotalea sp.]
MQIVIFETPEEVANHAADWVDTLLRQKPNAVLGLATGSTPIELYAKLVARHEQDALCFAKTVTFNLDEYFQIQPDSPQSYRSFMNYHLFNKVNIQKSNTYLPTCSETQNPRQQGLNYERLIKDSGGIDLQILGIGANGHIGFNEPSSSLASRTRIKTLTQQTLKDNSRLFGEDEYQPDKAMTMGIGTITDAKYVLLMATGKNKAEAVNNMITGPLSAHCPASALQMHENAIVVLDKEAASLLSDTEYYQWADSQNRKLNEKFGYYHNA